MGQTVDGGTKVSSLVVNVICLSCAHPRPLPHAAEVFRICDSITNHFRETYGIAVTKQQSRFVLNNALRLGALAETAIVYYHRHTVGHCVVGKKADRAAAYHCPGRAKPHCERSGVERAWDQQNIGVKSISPNALRDTCPFRPFPDYYKQSIRMPQYN